MLELALPYLAIFPLGLIAIFLAFLTMSTHSTATFDVCLLKVMQSSQSLPKSEKFPLCLIAIFQQCANKVYSKTAMFDICLPQVMQLQTVLIKVIIAGEIQIIVLGQQLLYLYNPGVVIIPALVQ